MNKSAVIMEEKGDVTIIVMGDKCCSAVKFTNDKINICFI